MNENNLKKELIKECIDIMENSTKNLTLINKKANKNLEWERGYWNGAEHIAYQIFIYLKNYKK